MNSTRWIVIAVVVLLALWDLFLYLTPRETISEAIRAWSLTIPTIPMWCGILCGHWFIPGKDRFEGRDTLRWGVLLAVTLASVPFGYFEPSWTMPVALLAGLGIGYFVWAMPR